jgi:Zn-dependent protease
MQMGAGSIQLGRVFGIRIGANPSWFLVLFVMIFSLSSYFRDVLPQYSQTTAYAIAVAAALLFFVSLVLHELGHAIVAQRNGIEVAGIDLWLFGGLAKLSRDSRSPGEEFRIAAAGPLVTLAVVAACTVAGAAISGAHTFLDAADFGIGRTSPGIAILGWLATINAFLFVFNMVPGFPLDGGRIARAIAWKITGDQNRGTRFSGRTGQVFSVVLIGLGLFVAGRYGTFNGLWLAAVGWFLNQAARGAIISSRFAERIEGVTAADVMDAGVLSIPGATTLIQAHDDFFERYGRPWYPVIDGGGHYLGLLRREQVDHALASGTPALEASEALEPGAGEEGRVRLDTPLETVLGSEALRRLGGLVVVDPEGRLRGLVTVDRLSRALAPTRL